jgi:hypothetical protein
VDDDPGILIEKAIKRGTGEIEGARMFVAGNIVGFRCVLTTMESMKSATRAFQDRMNALFELNVGPDLCWKTPEQIRKENSEKITL